MEESAVANAGLGQYFFLAYPGNSTDRVYLSKIHSEIQQCEVARTQNKTNLCDFDETHVFCVISHFVVVNLAIFFFL